MALDHNETTFLAREPARLAEGGVRRYTRAAGSFWRRGMRRVGAVFRLGSSFAKRSARFVAHKTEPIHLPLRSTLNDVHDRWVMPWVVKQPLYKWATKSIGRRIMVANLAGFVILFIGLMWISQANRWMVDAKVDSLTTQARMIAVAIAANAKVDTGGFTIDATRLPEAAGQSPTFGNPTFSSMELSIAPERVVPILNRLIQVGDVRARIYGLDGLLIVDSNQMLQRGQISRGTPARKPAPPQPDVEEKLKNAWTRFIAWITRSDLPVYRDIGGDRGTIYPEMSSALLGNLTSMLLINSAGEQIVAVAAPILHLGSVQGVVQLSSRPGEIDNILIRQRRALLVLALFALLASMIAAWQLYRTIAGPMQRLSDAAEQVSHNIGAERALPDFPGRRDEVAQMAVAFREMTNSLYRRLEASDRFAQDVAHELKNPVAAVRQLAERLSYAKTDERRNELAQQIQGEMKRLNRLISDVSKASRLDRELALQETEPLDFSELVRGMVTVLSDIHSDRGCKITLNLASGPSDGKLYMVRGHEGRLGQVMTNLIDNALSFSPEGGEVAVTISRAGADIVTTIDDQGPGIPPDRLEHVFKRFYSDRPQSDQTLGKNSGLGLSITREIVRAHGGDVLAENRPHVPGAAPSPALRPELEERRMPDVAGARFVLTLPAMPGGAHLSRA